MQSTCNPHGRAKIYNFTWIVFFSLRKKARPSVELDYAMLGGRYAPGRFNELLLHDWIFFVRGMALPAVSCLNPKSDKSLTALTIQHLQVSYQLLVQPCSAGVPLSWWAATVASRYRLDMDKHLYFVCTLRAEGPLPIATLPS